MRILAFVSQPSCPLGLAPAKPALALAWTALLTVGCGRNALLDPDNPSMPQISAGRDFSCALSRDATVRCWGRNHRGQLGDGTTATRSVPALITGDLAFQSIDTHGFSRHVCGVTTDGEAYCWGDNDFGELGNGTLEFSSVPVPVAGGQAFRSVSAGWRMSCGVTTNGAAYCWGRGVWGQLGDGLATQSLTPVKVSGDHQFAVVDVGGNNLVCGLTTSAQILCWGLDVNGSLGTGTPSVEICSNGQLELPCATTPTPILSDVAFKFVAAGQSYACGLEVSGQLWCWGRNDEAQLGTTTGETCEPVSTGDSLSCSRAPTPVEGLTAVSTVSAGVLHACAVTEEGQGICWGRNLLSQLGVGLVTIEPQPPSVVLGELNLAAVSAGMDHTCGVTREGVLYCWGANDLGQLGTGTSDIGLAPLLVNGGGRATAQW